MTRITGPISTLPGTRHRAPEAGTKCDICGDAPATLCVQGETDSFGSELNEMCEPCHDKTKEIETSGACAWCRRVVEVLVPTRDYDEGMSGPVYEVCSACRDKQNAQAQEEADQADHDRWWD